MAFSAVELFVLYWLGACVASCGGVVLLYKMARSAAPVVASGGTVVGVPTRPVPLEHSSSFTVRYLLLVEGVILVVVLWIDRAYSIFPGMFAMVGVLMWFLRVNPSQELYDDMKYEQVPRKKEAA